MHGHRNRRDFLKDSALAALGGALAASAAGGTASAAPVGQPAIALPPENHMGLPSGKLGNLQKISYVAVVLLIFVQGYTGLALYTPAQSWPVWGFFQLGRFAIDYRRRYGETPRATLLRSRP